LGVKVSIKVSIIVPVHNTEKYLERCLDSLVNQTLESIEIITINNGSTDNSQDILDRYKAKYPQKIKAVTIDIADLSIARNEGLKYAAGEYIGYVDSDDYVLANMFKAMYDKAVSGQFDVVACGTVYQYPSRSLPVPPGPKTDCTDENSIRESICALLPVVWNKIYKREILCGDIAFTPKTKHEDVDLIYRLYANIKSIGIVPDCLYVYIQRKSSIMRTNDKIFAYAEIFDNVIEYHKQNGSYERFNRELEYLYVRYMYGSTLKNLVRTGDYGVYKKGVQKLIGIVKEKCPRYRRNKLFYKHLPIGLYLVCFNRALASMMYAVLSRKKTEELFD